jgi:hypothetical protein
MQIHTHDLGTITVHPDNSDWVRRALGKGRSPDATAVSHVLYTWTPPAEMQPELPPGFTLTLRCATFPDEVRRFYPDDSFARFVGRAFAGGLAVLSRHQGWPDDRVEDCRIMHLFFRWAQRAREHFRNRLVDDTSLRVSRRGRCASDNQKALLPEPFGPGDRGGGKPTLGSVLRAGKEEALSRGIRRPNTRDSVVLGFTQAAERDPLRAAAHEVPGLVRAALYERCCSKKEIQPGVREDVIQRFGRVIGPHLKEPPGQFDQVLLGRKNNIIGQIARRTRHGPALDREVVRQVLLDLGWEAYAHVAAGLEAMMGAFRAALPEPLTAEERNCFGQLYLKQPHFGDLPFVLLVERFGFLEPVVWRLWADPQDREAVGALHRLLSYYSDIAPRRRSVDRVMKALSKARAETGRECLPCQMAEDAEFVDPGAASPAKELAEHDFIEAIARRVRLRRRIPCRCSSQCPDWQDYFRGEEEGAFLFEHRCRRCRFKVSNRLSVAECHELAAELDDR